MPTLRTITGPGGTLSFERHVDFGACPNVVLVRCWKRDEAAMRDFIARWTALRKFFPFKCILLVIDGALDDGSTLRSLEACGNPDWIVPLVVTGPAETKNWTRMLNGALRFLVECGVQEGILLCASFEAVLEAGAEAVFATLDPAYAIPAIGFRVSEPEGCTESVKAFLRARNPLEAIEGVIAHERNFFDAQQLPAVPVGAWIEKTLFFGRNTFQPWSLAPLLGIGGFDPRCNVFGGQEDTAARLRIQLSRLVFPLAKKIFRFRDKRVETGVLTHLGETPAEKILRESGAARQIFPVYHDEFKAWDGNGNFAIPRELMDFEW